MHAENKCIHTPWSAISRFSIPENHYNNYYSNAQQEENIVFSFLCGTNNSCFLTVVFRRMEETWYKQSLKVHVILYTLHPYNKNEAIYSERISQRAIGSF